MQTAALILAATRETDDAFERVVRGRETQLLRIAYRILGNWADAEDVAQDVFVRLHRHGLNFANEAALNSWLYRVAINLCIDRGRGARLTGELPELAAAHPSAEAELIRGERKELLMMALSRLPARERAAVVLREIEGLSSAEVAAALGSSEGTVRSQVSKAMAKLREILRAEEM